MRDPAETARDILTKAEDLISRDDYYVEIDEAVELENKLLAAFRLLIDGEFSIDMALIIIYPFVRGLEERRHYTAQDRNNDYRQLIAHVRLVACDKEEW